MRESWGSGFETVRRGTVTAPDLVTVSKYGRESGEKSGQAPCRAPSQPERDARWFQWYVSLEWPGEHSTAACSAQLHRPRVLVAAAPSATPARRPVSCRDGSVPLGGILGASGEKVVRTMLNRHPARWPYSGCPHEGLGLESTATRPQVRKAGDRSGHE